MGNLAGSTKPAIHSPDRAAEGSEAIAQMLIRVSQTASSPPARFRARAAAASFRKAWSSDSLDRRPRNFRSPSTSFGNGSRIEVGPHSPRSLTASMR